MNRPTRTLPGRSAAALLTGAAVLGVPTAALAGFGARTPNAGNAVQAASLLAASGTTAAPSPTSPSSAIDVSWSAPDNQAPGPVAYRVLDTTTGMSVCSNMTSGSSPMSCTESGLLPGTSYGYTVEAYLPNTRWTKDASVTATTADVFGIATPAEVTAGTAFTTTVTAEKATSATNRTLMPDTAFAATSVTFSGPTAVGRYSPTYGTVSFASGVARVSTKLYAAGSSSITATAGQVIGTSAGLTVDSAGGQMTLSGNQTVSHTAGGSFSITMPSDQYGNGFVSASGVPVTVTLTPASHPNNSWSLNGQQSTTQPSTLNLTVKTGPTGNTFSVQPGSKATTASLSATTTAPGFTAPPPETLTES